MSPLFRPLNHPSTPPSLLPLARDTSSASSVLGDRASVGSVGDAYSDAGADTGAYGALASPSVTSAVEGLVLEPPPASPAHLAARLVSLHEQVADLLGATLGPLSPLASQLSASQKDSLFAQLQSARQAAAISKQLVVPNAAPSPVTAGGSATAATSAPPTPNAAAAAATASAAGGGSSDSLRQASRTEPLARAKSGPAILAGFARRFSSSTKLTRAAADDTALPSRSSDGEITHYTKVIRQVSRGGSDSKLVSQPARIKSLRSGFRNMFVSPGASFFSRKPKAQAKGPVSWSASARASASADEMVQ